jgi:uncharacterized alpha-E superfamily protein
MLLARKADAVFWMARYVERAENLARILDVQQVFAGDARDPATWSSVVQLNADDERFFQTHEAADRASVIHFYVLDQDNPTSIVSAVHAARENARTLRPLISTEMWAQINVFHRQLKALTINDLSEPRLPKVCTLVKEACETHTGITEGTFFRDEAWYFYSIGRWLERADQTTRLLDIKYHQLLPRGADIGSAFDLGQWNSVLRSAAAYHAYRRVHSRAMSPATIASFLLQNRSFPRSVALCVNDIDRTLHEFKSRYGLRGGSAALERVDDLRGQLAGRPIEQILATGLHEFLDLLQAMLGKLAEDIGRDFFYRDEPAGQPVAQDQ